MLYKVFLSDGIGIAMMLLLLITNMENFIREKKLKNFRNMVYIALITCAIEIIAVVFDGTPGAFVTVILYIADSWIYVANIVIAFFLKKTEDDFVGIRTTRLGDTLLYLLNGAGLALLVVNIFCPIVFAIDNNVYSRGNLYWLYLVIGFADIAYAIGLYIVFGKKSGILMPLSIVSFVAPIVIGVTIQSMFYGTTLIWVSIAVALTGMAFTIKDSKIYYDSLTGVYNRFYLEKIVYDLKKTSNEQMTGIMVDINGFKKINDTLGHEVGDEALVAAAKIFMGAVGKRDLIFRYGGDEFVILINTTNEGAVSRIVSEIVKGCEEYSCDNEYGLKMSVSMGIAEFDSRRQSFEKFLRSLDKQMYDQKLEYHRVHDVKETLNVKLGELNLSSEILENSGIGLWAFELDEGVEPRMYIDDAMLELLGLKQHVSPEETYHAWYDHVDTNSYDLVNEAVQKMTAGEHAEVQYPWHHPAGYVMIVRCGGVRNPEYKKGVRIEGTHQNVTEMIHLDIEQRKYVRQELST